MTRAFIVLLLLAHASFAGLQRYRDRVVADGVGAAKATRAGLRLTYLGVNGYQFETAGHALLVDPYFSRHGIGTVIFSRRMASEPDRVAQGLAHIRPKVDAILVTHAHFDHLLDVPAIMERTHARLLAGPTAVRIAESRGIPSANCTAVKSGSVHRIGPWTIRVCAARHDHIFGVLPLPRSVGEPLAFIIEGGGRRIYIDSGGTPGLLPPARKVDLAILGAALPDSRQRLPDALDRLRPRFFLPSHQDEMFRPADDGFVFELLTNFPAVTRARLSGRLILLDYFRPWTLP